MFYEQLFHDKRKLEVDLQIYEDLKYAKYTIQIWAIRIANYHIISSHIFF